MATHTENAAALETHAINAQAIIAITSKNVADFVNARESELARQEAVFLASLNLAIGEGMERAEDEVDIDD
ncbi:hypothetical protein D3C87_1832180 [compost metagenome]